MKMFPLLAATALIVALFSTNEAISSPESTTSELRDKTPQEIRSVLRMPEFSTDGTDRKSLLELIEEWLGWLFRGVGHGVAAIPIWLLWIIIVWLVISLVAIIVHMLWTFYAWLPMFQSAAASDANARGELLGIRDLDFDHVHAEARRLLAAGNHADATRFLYVAAILWLDRLGWIAFHPAKTDGDYLRELQSRQDARRSLFGLVTPFQRVAYAGAPATLDNCQAMATALDSLRAQKP